MFKQLLIVLLIAFVLCEDICPAKKQAQCQKDAQKAYQQCDKAAKEKGKDQTADINCVKYLLASRADCWPCICKIAKAEGWKIKGCDAFQKIIDIAEDAKEIINKLSN